MQSNQDTLKSVATILSPRHSYAVRNCIAFAVCLAIMSASAVQADISPEHHNLMELIVGRQEQTLARIQSIRYKTTESVDMQPVPGFAVTHSETTRTVVQKGAWRAVTLQVKHVQSTGGEQEYTRRAVLNDSYFAVALTGTGPDLFIHRAIDQMSKKSRDAYHTYCGPDLLSYGFGDGRGTLSVWYRKAPSQMRWEVVETADGNSRKDYLIRHFRPDIVKDTAVPFYEWYISPDAGYQVVRVLKHMPDSRIGEELRVTLEKHGDDAVIWLAKRVEEARYPVAQGHDGSAKPIMRRVCVYSDIHVNPAIPDSTFTLAYLQCKDGTLANKIVSDGSSETLVMVDNDAVPQEVAKRILSAKRTFHAQTGAPQKAQGTTAPANVPTGPVADSATDTKPSASIVTAWYITGGVAVPIVLGCAACWLWRAGSNHRRLRERSRSC